ncbi:cation:proton antiporter domain-containing protein [Streptosporangium sandarakinum]
MSPEQVAALLLGVAVIIIATRLAGTLVARLGQPPVIGEILAGILLGPTLFHGAVTDALFPADIRSHLGVLANIGVMVFMFLVGLELDHALLRGTGRLAVSVSLSSILLPLGLGALLGLYLLESHPNPHRLGFALFVGAAMAVTAFPVLARILTDRGMHRTATGGLALTCAAVDDVLAWSLLAVVVAVTGADTGQWHAVLVLPYVALMFWVVRPLLRRLAAAHRRTGHLSPGMLAAVLAGLMLSGCVTEWIGLHFIFGAFLFGVVMPREGADRLREEISERVGQVSTVLLLPIFFVVSGLKVDLSTVGMPGLAELALILLVAVGGKFAGAFTAARLNGLPPHQSATLATLMNTRGLTELVILSAGLQLGLLDTGLYSLMVVMALVTTAMAGPLLQLLRPGRTPVAAGVREAELRSSST